MVQKFGHEPAKELFNFWIDNQIINKTEIYTDFFRKTKETIYFYETPFWKMEKKRSENNTIILDAFAKQRKMYQDRIEFLENSIRWYQATLARVVNENQQLKQQNNDLQTTCGLPR